MVRVRTGMVKRKTTIDIANPNPQIPIKSKLANPAFKTPVTFSIFSFRNLSD